MARIIGGQLSATEIVAADRVAQAGRRLVRTLGGLNPVAKQNYATRLFEMAELVKTSIAEGDVRSDAEPEVVSTTIVDAMLGAELLPSAVSDGADLRPRSASTLQELLPMLVAENSFGYYRDLEASPRYARRMPNPPANLPATGRRRTSGGAGRRLAPCPERRRSGWTHV